MSAVAEPLSRADAFVELESATVTYGREERAINALAATSLRIAPGDFVALVGPSGCGKSTILKLVTGLIRATSGLVYVSGREVGAEPMRVGMAFQNPTLLPWRDTLSNTMLPLEIVQPHRRALRRNRQKYVALARDLLAAVGLDGFERQQPWRLSGGMQQRASLCRSLIHDPKLLMLDEPFAALDAFTREELWAVLQDLWLERKFTCALVTHDLREAAYLADVIFVMSARPGRIVATHRIDLPRPRTLDMTFEPKFVDAVHEIRLEIGKARSEARARPQERSAQP